MKQWGRRQTGQRAGGTIGALGWAGLERRVQLTSKWLQVDRTGSGGRPGTCPGAVLRGAAPLMSGQPLTATGLSNCVRWYYPETVLNW